VRGALTQDELRPLKLERSNYWKRFESKNMKDIIYRVYYIDESGEKGFFSFLQRFGEIGFDNLRYNE